jgi:arsenite/tail-anchored protein-transporting ATPase
MSVPHGMDRFDGLRLAMFSGKGGVGKTTLSCGWARAWAQRFPNQQILLLSTDPAHSLGDVLAMEVTDTVRSQPDLPNLWVRALDAEALLQQFKAQYGAVLERLVERGSFVEQGDLTPVWDLSWPGLDELMGILEIQRILRAGPGTLPAVAPEVAPAVAPDSTPEVAPEISYDRVVVDMAPSGHTLNLFGLMDFLDEFLGALELFQEKHRVISRSLTGRHTPDAADHFLQMMAADLAGGRRLLQDAQTTACLAVAIAEPMSLLETRRFMEALVPMGIATGGVFVNRIVGLTDQINAPEHTNASEHTDTPEHTNASEHTSDDPQSHRLDSQRVDHREDNVDTIDRRVEEHHLLTQFMALAGDRPLLIVPQQSIGPVGGAALDHLMHQLQPATEIAAPSLPIAMQFPEKVGAGLPDFITQQRRLILVGGKGGVGKTTVAAAIAWGMAQQHGDRNIRIISIDPAHSLGDALDVDLAHEPTSILPNLRAQEINAEKVLDTFREDYLWELAAMMSGDDSDAHSDMKLQMAYGPEAWRRIVSQALPGIDEMLSLVAVMELLESQKEDLIILDTAPTGHLLRFLAMPTALGDWLAWIFRLWIKYQSVLGRTDLMGRLRTLRQRVMQAQKKLLDPQHTEFIGVVQAQVAILAEAQRLTETLAQLGVAQPYVVHNRYRADLTDLFPGQPFFPNQTVVRLPELPRSIEPIARITGAAKLLF